VASRRPSALQAGLWLWLLGTDRVRLPVAPLAGLLAHDLIVAAALAGCLFFARRGITDR